MSSEAREHCLADPAVRFAAGLGLTVEQLDRELDGLDQATQIAMRVKHQVAEDLWQYFANVVLVFGGTSARYRRSADKVAQAAKQDWLFHEEALHLQLKRARRANELRCNSGR